MCSICTTYKSAESKPANASDKQFREFYASHCPEITCYNEICHFALKLRVTMKYVMRALSNSNVINSFIRALWVGGRRRGALKLRVTMKYVMRALSNSYVINSLIRASQVEGRRRGRKFSRLYIHHLYPFSHCSQIHKFAAAGYFVEDETTEGHFLPYALVPHRKGCGQDDLRK